MAQSEYRLLSRPAEVVFAGFRSTTLALQQAGWQLSMDQDVRAGRLHLALHHPGAGLYMLADEIHHDFLSGVHGSFERHEHLTFVIRHCSSRIEARARVSFDDFRPIDAVPQMVQIEHKRIEDFNIFASQLVRTEEILIEPQSVAECLDLIRKMQAPELAAVRERNRRRELTDAMPQQAFHAQIMSLAA